MFKLLESYYLNSLKNENAGKFSWQKRTNSVAMYAFKPSSILLVNVVNLHDQLEPDMKAAWENLSPSHEIADCMDSH